MKTSMSYSRGDIIVLPFPFVFTHGEKVQKARPALVISDMTLERRYFDLILAAITSRLPDVLKDTEMILEPTATNGLLKKSALRLEFLMTVPSALVLRTLGRLNEQEMHTVDLKLLKSLGIKT